MDLATKAAEFAKQAHGDQRRKYTNVPYFTHLHDVATLLHDNDLSDVVVAAGYLHDTLEDTATTRQQLEAQFGLTVARLVCEVTDVSKPEDGNRKTRKALDRDHLAKSSPDGASIKLADLISNTRDIVANAPDFAKVYLAEKADLLPVLRHGDPSLWNKAQALLEVSKAMLADVE